LFDIKIRRPKPGDKEKLYEFFNEVVTDTFKKEGIDDISVINEEIEVKRKYLQYDLDSNGKHRYFLIAEYNENIIGTIEYGQCNDLIISTTNGGLKHIVEVGTVFVKPNYQRQGIGNLLLKSLFEIMKDKGIEEFCLDSGYSDAQKVWTKKFGPPDYFLEDYWGEGMHHMIWKVDLKLMLNIK
jgi:GNAT superfamily N-acetyltransferase